jgi:hypothetical protein
MDPRKFTNLIAEVNGNWLGRQLDLGTAKRYGIDLYNDQFGVELKSRMARYTPTWACDVPQIEEFKKDYPGKELLWALMLYGFSKRVNEIEDRFSDKLPQVEQWVTSRETWLVPVSLLELLEQHTTQSTIFVYPGLNKDTFPRPDFFQDFDTGEGIIHIAKTSGLIDRMH